MPLEIKDLSHVYMPGSPLAATAVHNVNAVINDGEFVGLIGHTGSGKSTLVQHLNGLLKPTSGTVIVNGQDLQDKSTSLRDIRKKVGLVFQYPEYQLFEETVAQDIGYGPRNLGLSEDEIKHRVQEAAKLTGVTDEMMEKSPFELSGGQKRRVAIAGVLAMQPDILILDEPAAGLDPHGREEMLALLKQLHIEKGNTMLMVSHSMTDVARLCDRILVMNHGEMAMDGTPDEVFSRGDELEAMGLGLPDGAQLARVLREKGFVLPQGLWRTEDLAKVLVAQLRGGEAHV